MIRRANRVIEFLALAAVVCSTLGLGGVYPWSQWAALALLALAFWIWAALRIGSAGKSFRSHGGDQDPDTVPPLSRGSGLILGLLVVLTLYLLLQITPLPRGWVTRLSPQRVAWQTKICAGLGTALPRQLTLAVDGVASRRALNDFRLALLAFWAGSYLGCRRRRARRVMKGLIVIVLLEALYGLAEKMTGHNQVLWFGEAFGGVCGTFINRNHYAALLALMTPATIGWLLYRAAEPVYNPRFDAYRTAGLWEVLGSRRGLWLLAPAILLIGVIQSLSRGGLIALASGLTLFFGLATRSRLNRTLAGLTALLVLVLFAYVLSGDYEVVLGRFQNMRHEDHVESRAVVWRDSLRMMRDYPLFGVGLGNFGPCFRRYSSQDSGVTYIAQAHNEWLEALLTLGLLGALPLVFLGLAIFRIIFRNVRRGGADRPWLLGGACGLLGLATHSLMEFNFHMPAITITAMLLTGVLVGYQPRCPEPDAEEEGRKP